MANDRGLEAWQKRRDAYDARKQAMDYATMTMWVHGEQPVAEKVVARAAMIEKYLTSGIVPKAAKRVAKK